SELKVAVPPIPEQKKISNILTNFDDLIENQIYLLDSYNLLKKGLMQKLLTGRIRVRV
ncbi:MAG: restriction endonuclease subunit S, partial [Bacteroidetes bacterium]|nr:restriction endonuclease subunit S [Bacteroidota bacterium]